MPLAREQRKLAAIVAADVVGYSRLMGRDESGTLARLRKNRSEHLDPILAKYGGRLVKLTGDGALVEFASAVDALSAAIEFQQAMAEANGDQPADTALVFRIGLHLGDLIVDGDDLYGDGVNVAARLEGEVPAGGILVSRNIRDAVAGRVRATFEDLGSLSLKNIERAVRRVQGMLGEKVVAALAVETWIFSTNFMLDDVIRDADLGRQRAGRNPARASTRWQKAPDDRCLVMRWRCYDKTWNRFDQALIAKSTQYKMGYQH